MFTGIVRERGRVVSMQQEPEGLRFEIDAPATASQLGIGDSVSVGGACLTATAVSNGRFSVTAVAETLEPNDSRPARAQATRSTSRPRPVQATHSAAISCRVTSTRSVGSPRVEDATRLGRGGARDPALLRREGLDHGRRRLAHDRRPARECLRGRADPAHARSDDARGPRAGRRGQPRGGRARQVRRETDRPGYDFGLMTQTAPRDQQLRRDRGRDRGHPPGQVRGRRRRGRPRERGRPDDRGPVRDARGDQLHGHARARPDLPPADRRALRRARSAPDGRSQRGTATDGFHRLDRGPRGRVDRNLRAGPLAHDPGRDRPDQGARRPRPARPRLPAARTRRRRAQARRPDGGGRRPRTPRGPQSRGRRLRGDEGGRDDGARPRPRRVLRAARASS